MSIVVSKEERLAKALTFAEAARADRLDTLKAAYEQAVKDKDEDTAADAARALRNKLLELSDKEVTLDRLNLNTSSAVAFITSLKNVFDSAWAKYRKSLRDLPQQEGFPLTVEFPKAPEEKKATEE